MEYFKNELKISFSENAEDIRFVHQKSFEDQKNFFLHLNNYIEIYIFVSGKADYVIEEHYMSLERGDVLIISPHEAHVPIIKEVCDYERFYLLIPTDIFRNMKNDPIVTLLKKDAHSSPRIRFTEEYKEKAFRLLYSMSELSSNYERVGTDIRALGALFQFLGLVIESQKSSSLVPTIKARSSIPALLHEALEYMSNYPKEIGSVSDIAEHFYISVPYFSTLFKKHIGVNASNYLQIQKIALAKKLLEDGETVAFTCYECGFSDSSHFIKIFKRFVGMTPKQYKTIHTKDMA